jgi:hypothetical protein
VGSFKRDSIYLYGLLKQYCLHPESMLIERAIKSDKQVKAAADLLADKSKYDTVLARINTGDNPGLDRATELASGGRLGTGSYGILPSESEKEVGVRLNFKF